MWHPSRMQNGGGLRVTLLRARGTSVQLAVGYVETARRVVGMRGMGHPARMRWRPGEGRSAGGCRDALASVGVTSVADLFWGHLWTIFMILSQYN